MRKFSSSRVGFWYCDPCKVGLLSLAMSTWTSSIICCAMGKGIFLTTRITSSTLVLIEGGSRPLRLLEARLLHRAGRYHFRLRRALRRTRRSSIRSLTSLRWWISAEKSAFPLPTQQMPVIWLPLSMPARTSCTHPSQCQLSWIVNGQRLTTLALSARSNFRAFAGVQGIKGCPSRFRTYTNMVAISPPFGVKCSSRMLRWLFTVSTPSAFAYP